MMGNNRITDQNITELKDNEIFVFGSNESGRHGKGAAKTAMKFGAKYGQASGAQGKTYAILTVNASISNKLKISKIEMYVNDFIQYVKQHKELIFLVTEIGCGLAGHAVEDIAPLFKKCKNIDNIYLPIKFWRII